MLAAYPGVLWKKICLETGSAHPAELASRKSVLVQRPARLAGVVDIFHPDMTVVLPFRDMVTTRGCHRAGQALEQAGLAQIQLALPVQQMIRPAVENGGFQGGFFEHDFPGALSPTVFSRTADQE